MITHEDIDGWFDFPDLYDHAVESAQDGAQFVELGTFLGKSAAYMIRRIHDSGKRITFATIDTFTGSPTEPDQLALVASLGGTLRHAATNLIHQACVGCDVDYRIIESDSAAAAHLFNPASVDFLFIDADHTTPGVLRDIRAWIPRLKPGGIIAGHDIDSGHVRAAVEHIFGARYRTQGRCWVTRPCG